MKSKKQSETKPPYHKIRKFHHKPHRPIYLLVIVLIVLAFLLILPSIVPPKEEKVDFSKMGFYIPTDIEKQKSVAYNQVAFGGKVIAITRERFKIAKGNIIETYAAFRNTYDESKTFNIKINCEKCITIAEPKSVTLTPEGITLVKLTVDGNNEPGQYPQEVEITDENNNFYARKLFIAKIE